MRLSIKSENQGSDEAKVDLDNLDDNVFLSPTKEDPQPDDQKLSTLQRPPPKYPTFSDSAVCRICHGSEASGVGPGGKGCAEPLISPCYCSGTMGLYHRSCLERWLAMSNKHNCEICSFTYATVRKPKSVWQFLLSPNNSGERKNLVGDIICWLVLTPLAIASTWLCVDGAVRYSQAEHRTGKHKDNVEVPGLISLACFLVLTYSIWLFVSVRFHYKVCKTWREHNQVVHILDAPVKDHTQSPLLDHVSPLDVEAMSSSTPHTHSSIATLTIAFDYPHVFGYPIETIL